MYNTDTTKETKMTKTNKNTIPSPYIITVPAINFEVYPHDLPKTMTFLDAEKAVKNLGNDWRIPTLEELRLIYKQKDAIGNFCTEPSTGYPVWYWSSTEHRAYPSSVHNVRFSGGNEGWGHKDNSRLSCRPVRLVAAPASLG